MVIAKIHQNSSARATLKYVLSKSGASVIGGNAADWVERDALTKAQLASHIDTATGQLQQAIALKSLARPLYHISLSLPPQETLDDEPLCAFAEQYLAGLILSAEQPDLLKFLSEPQFKAALEKFRDEELYKYCYTLVRHTDQSHPHVHLVIAKTNLETEKSIPTSHDRYRSQRVLRYLERQHGLAVQPHSWEVGRQAESTQQAQAEIKMGQPSVHKQLQMILEQSATKSQTVPAFIEQVQAAGVEVRVQFTRTGKSKGISYGWQGVALAGNALGTRYSFKQGEPGLVKNLGLSYEPERDRPLIQALCERPPETLQSAQPEAPLAPALSLAVAQQQHQAWFLQVAAEAETEPDETELDEAAEPALALSDQVVPINDQAVPFIGSMAPAPSASLDTAFVPQSQVTSGEGTIAGVDETATKPPPVLSQTLPPDPFPVPPPTPPVRQPQAEHRQDATPVPLSAPTASAHLSHDSAEPALSQPHLVQPVATSVPAGEDEQADLESLRLRQQGEAQQRQVWGMAIAKIAQLGLLVTGQTSPDGRYISGQTVLDDDHLYRLQFRAPDRSLLVAATDGRGILVVYQEEKLTVSEQVTALDWHCFQQQEQHFKALQLLKKPQKQPPKTRSKPAKDKKAALEQ